MNSNYKVVLEVSDAYSQFTAEQVEAAIRDLLVTAVMPSIGLELITTTITKKRG